jgi:hypothetical protein
MMRDASISRLGKTTREDQPSTALGFPSER